MKNFAFDTHTQDRSQTGKNHGFSDASVNCGTSFETALGAFGVLINRHRLARPTPSVEIRSTIFVSMFKLQISFGFSFFFNSSRSIQNFGMADTFK